MIDYFEQAFTEAISQLDSIGETIARSPDFQIDDPNTKIMLQLTLENYFRHIPIEQKKSILSAILPLNQQAEPLDFLPHLLGKAGPHFQKLAQAMGGQAGLSARVQTIFQKVQKNALPISWWLVRQIIDANDYPFEWISIDREPYAVASMAQVHKAVILFEGKRLNVIIRILKPDIGEAAASDGRVLQQISPLIDQDPQLVAAKMPKLADYTDDIIYSVEIELDGKATEARQMESLKSYVSKEIIDLGRLKLDLNFDVPRVIPVNTTNGVSIQTMARGGSIQDIMNELKGAPPHLSQKVLEALARLWWRSVLQKGGFFHGDMHPGNFMVHLNEKNELEIHIIDFGMGGVLDQSLRDALYLASAGALVNSSKAIARGLWTLRDLNKPTVLDLPRFEERIAAEIRASQGRSSQTKLLQDWVNWSAEQGLKFSFDVLNLRRSIGMLDELLSAAGSRYDMGDIASEVAGEKFSRDGWKLLVSGAFTPRQFFQLAGAQVRAMRSAKAFAAEDRRSLEDWYKKNPDCKSILDLVAR